MTTSSHATIQIAAPTLFEYLLTRSVRPSVPVRHVGMRLARLESASPDGLLILCGLAGALTPELRPGDVVIPEEASFEGDTVKALDPTLVDAVRQAATTLGYSHHGGRLLTASNLVTGEERRVWASRGFLAVDMETGLLPIDLRFATVRVILDAPRRSISSDWESPIRALASPKRWSEMLWMARYAPVYARRAAMIASVAARTLSARQSP